MKTPDQYHPQVKKYLAYVRRTQAELAKELIRDPSDLNRLLTGASHLTEQTGYDIVRILAEWEAFTYRQEVVELLEIRDFGRTKLINWNLPPFSKLKEFPPDAGAAQSEVKPTSAISGSGISPLVNGFTSSDHTTNMHVFLEKLVRRPLPTPPPAPEFFGGRSDELVELKGMLKNEEMVTLTAVKGLGGIGKTTLAQRLASDLYRSQADKYFSMVLWTEINRTPNIMKLLTDWALMADPTFIYRNQSLKKLANTVKMLLNEYLMESYGTGKLERSLVVFDDVWDKGIETIEVLREACPDNATILITTRSGKAARLLSKNIMQLDKLEPVKGVELLKEYIRDVDESKLAELSEVLDGHALALTLAARRLILETDYDRTELLQEHIKEYRENIPKGTPFADLELEQGEDKEKNLSVALFFSYDELNPEEQRCFRALGRLPYNAAFNELTISNLWNISKEKTRKVSQRLRLLSLIDEDKKTSNELKSVWYRQHPLVRAYALALLKEH